MGYFDSSDEESDYEVERPKKTTTIKKKKSFLDDSDSDSDSDSDDDDIDFDDSFLGDFRKKQAKASAAAAFEKQKLFELDATETTQPLEQEEEEEEEEEEAAEEQRGVVYRETTTDWMETLRLLRQRTSRDKRGATQVRFVDVIVTETLEYQQDEDSARSVNEADHVAEDHDEIPWYEQDYEELPWHMQPDLDEDDAITALCKKVLAAKDREEGHSKQQQGDDSDADDDDEGEKERKRLSLRAAAVEANVLGFAIKLRSRVAVGKA